ncbi:TetR/AcrR family transcriptional regulator [Kiloniella laminariae]|uniref:TetR/AcrR family transcriptional regulator n=1 Tax=Kiloniella laminariae TaxID=454162 RepID=A0ABT4LP56_9PROT|nr:TetR/AcrR family transcriptional regulator [Kiloniella laminariae]MCZ4282923.1 TetR/AcrR family transcriptional regulator [Kiloniella laminariae]
MPPPKRNKYLSSSLSTRDLIVKVAEQLIATHGVEGLKLKDVTKEIGIQLPSLYAHFAGRSAVLIEIGKRICEGIVADFDKIENLPPREALIEHTRLMVRRYTTNRAHVLVLLADFAAPQGIDALNANEAILYPYYERLSAMLERGRQDGLFKTIAREEFIANRLGIILVNIAFASLKTGVFTKKQAVRLEENVLAQIDFMLTES